ncbi:hypothetical protein DV737_g296, partial [Chaetothyriales sp. CBS 132003]
MVESGDAELGVSPQPGSSKAKGQNEYEKQNKEKILAFKGTHILLSILFLWFLAVQLLGLVLFCKGFLLTRLVLDSKSACRTLPNDELSLAKDGCWHPKTFNKAVIIVIDALRYDFTVPSSATTRDRESGHYLDNFPLLYDSAVRQPQNAFLLPFIADPPTSTLQRLKGLTTGTLPVFIDVGSNFAGTAIEEDNIVSQLKAAGKKMVHLGDDTWHALFPGYFVPDLTHAYDSFNAWDLHTVDNGVIEHIFPLLDGANQTKWDVIFAHFLGVDHAGHRYGPNHPAMAEKLRQMNQVLEEIVTKIDDQTLLVVMGDHGMDAKGDHGGESDNEVEAALWLYSKKPRFERTGPGHKLPPTTAKERPVAQIDLVSTLSLLLGLPIPFNNLGTPIPEAFIGSGKESWKNLAKAELLAFEQIQNYQNEYSRSRDLGSNEQQYKLYRHVVLTAQSKNWKAIHDAYVEWHRETIRMYRELWANFNTSDMLHGIEILSLALAVLFILSRLWAADLTNSLPGLLHATGLGTVGGTLVGPLLGVALPGLFTATVGAVYGMGIGGIVGAGVSIFMNSRSQAAGFAANSFTIHEDTILLFFLSTFGTIALMSSLRQNNGRDRTLGLAFVALYWAVDAADNGEWLKNQLSSSTLETTKLTLARLTLAVALPVGIGTFGWAKPCIDISLDKTHQQSEDPTRPPATQITILGNSAIGPVVLAMLGSYHFFKTGHQAVLSSIQWNSAFVPFQEIHYPWSPLLVILNTFGAQLLCAAAVPLTVLWKRQISKDVQLQEDSSDKVKQAAEDYMNKLAAAMYGTTSWILHDHPNLESKILPFKLPTDKDKRYGAVACQNGVRGDTH